MVHLKSMVALLVVSLMSAPLWGLQNPDLSGRWKLNVAKSHYGDLQGPSSRTDTIEQHDGEITETVKAEQRHQEQRYVLRFSTDGRKTILQSGAGIHIPHVTLHTISATWHGGALLVMEGLTIDDSSLTAMYAYKISDDAKVLTMILSLGGGKPAATFIFDRQNGLKR